MTCLLINMPIKTEKTQDVLYCSVKHFIVTCFQNVTKQLRPISILVTVNDLQNELSKRKFSAGQSIFSSVSLVMKKLYCCPSFLPNRQINPPSDLEDMEITNPLN